MKEKAIVLTAIVMTIFLSLATVHSYHRLKNSQQQKTASQQKAVDELAAKQTRLEADLVTRVNELHTECEKGVKAFALLTAPQKAKLSEPYCGLSIVQ